MRFDYDDRNNVSGMYRGKRVYRDNNHLLDINPGEIWIVSLSLNPSTGQNYFAKPLQRIDGSFLYEMKKDEIDSLSAYLWENNRTILQPFLEEIYKDVVNEQIAKAVREQTAAFEKTISDMAAQIDELKRIKEEDSKIIASKEEEVEILKAKVLVMENEPAKPSKQPSAKPRQDQDPPEGFEEKVKPSKHAIVRTGPDTLKSDGFKKSRYFVHLSADHKTLLIRDDPNGNIVCIESTVTLAGLSTVLPFDGERPLESEYSARYGGTLVYLKRRDSKVAQP